MTPNGGEGTNNRKNWFWFVSAGAAALVLGIGTAVLAYSIIRPLALLFLGITIGSTLSPFVTMLEKRMPRMGAVLTVYLILLLLLFFLVWSVVPMLIAQSQELAGRIPGMIQTAQDWLNQAGREFLPPFFGESVLSQLGTLASVIVSLPIGLASSIAEAIVVVFLSLYWLAVEPQLTRFLLSLFPESRHDRIRDLMRKVETGMGGYLRGSALNGLVIGLMTYLGLVLLGINYPVLLALIAGVFEIIPAIGPILSGGFIVMVALLESPRQALFSLIFVLLLQQAENQILVPNIMRSQTEIPPLLILFSIIAGAAAGGLLGVLIAIPLAAAIRVVVLEILAPRLRKLNHSALGKQADETNQA